MKEALDAAEEGRPSSEFTPHLPTAAVVKWIAMADLILRLCGAIAALGSAIAMATSSQTIITFSLVQFKMQFKDLPSLT